MANGAATALAPEEWLGDGGRSRASKSGSPLARDWLKERPATRKDFFAWTYRQAQFARKLQDVARVYEEILSNIEADAASTSIADEIDGLYNYLAALERERDRVGTDVPEVEEELQAAFLRLRELQTTEVAHMEAEFAASLLMPLGRGEEVLRRVRKLLSAVQDSSLKGSDAR